MLLTREIFFHNEKRKEIYFSKQSCNVLLIIDTVKPNEIPNPFTIKQFFAAEGVKITLELEFPFSKQSCNVPLLYTL